jgi:hypothetical protein
MKALTSPCRSAISDNARRTVLTRERSDRDGLLLANQHDQSLAAGHPGVEEIPLQHRVMLGECRDDNGGIFGALALMNRRRIGRHQRVELAESVGHGPAVEAGGEFARVCIDIYDVADIAVVDLLLVIVFDLHDLVAGGKGPSETFHLAVPGRVKSRLEFDVQRARPDAAAVHRAQHLDVAHRIQTEALRYSGLDQLDDPRDSGFGIVRRNEVKVAVALRPS